MPAGTNVASGVLVSPGGQQGIPGPGGPNVVSTDSGNQATLGSDSRIYVPDPTPVITSVRLRSFSAIGNPSFEVDQVSAGAQKAIGTAAKICDRWFVAKSGTMVVNASTQGGNTILPGTNFQLSSRNLGLTVATAQASMTAGDYLMVYQYIEGPVWRELQNDVHSISLLIASTVTPLTFCVYLRDATSTRTLVKSCTINAASTFTLFQLPNLPLWAAGGGFTNAPGSASYMLGLTFACGSTGLAPAPDVWQTGNYSAVSGISNFASALNSIYLGFVQHEPGPICTTLIDKPFTQNYDECLRYYQKTYPYSVKPGTSGATVGLRTQWQPVANTAFFSPNSFIKPMAKIPTLVLWDPNTGAAGSYSYQNTTSTVVSAYLNVGDSGYGGFQSGGAPTAGSYGYWHHTADTGW